MPYSVRYFKLIVVMIILPINYCLTQCEIEDLEINVCETVTVLDLSFYETNLGLYDYFLLDELILVPDSFIISGGEILQVIFMEDNSNCIDSFEITINKLNAPIVNILNDPLLNCLIGTLAILIDISESNGHTINWAGPGLLTDPNDSIAIVSECGFYDYQIVDTVSLCIVDGQVEVKCDYNFPIIAIDSINNCDGTMDLVGTAITVGSLVSFFWTGPGIISDINEPTITIDNIGNYILYVEDEEYYCISEMAIDVLSLDCISGVENGINTRAPDIIPNPFTDFLNIKFEDEFKSVSVYDELGKLITFDYLNMWSINSENWEKGVYYILVQGNDKVWIKKAVKVN
jgi:hypothetical protein